MVDARILRRVPLACFVLGVLGAFGCVESSFARRNPFDRGADLTVRIIATRDTVSATEPVVLLQMVSDPPVVGYEVLWGSAKPSVLAHEGNGVFRLLVVPTVRDSVVVFGWYLGGADATRTIFVEPSP